jgi:hypothetical protein
MAEMSERKRALALTFCRRGDLADGSPGAKPSPAFLRSLAAYDRGLELYWHPVRHRWILYRVTRRAACSGSDMMLKEFEITGPDGEYRLPGWWLLEVLRKLDKTRNGTIDPRVANNLYHAHLKEEEEKEEAERVARMSDMGESFGRDMWDYACSEKVSNRTHG